MDLKAFLEIPPWNWPEGAGDSFLAVLEDRTADESERLLAADLAGDFVVINDNLANALISIAVNNDESEALRGQAAISLGPALENAFIMGFDDPDDILISEETFTLAEESLKGLFLDRNLPQHVRRMALEASARSPQDWHRDAIQSAYASDDKDWKLTAVFCMRFVRGFNEQILAELRNTDPEFQYQALCAAGNWEIKAAEPVITSFLTTPGTDKDLLLAAIEAVATVCPEKASQLLDHLLLSDDEDIVDAVHETLGMAGALLGLENDWDDDDKGYLH